MKKKNLKPMIISALLAVGFGATSVGTSFALFTDHADTTINVTAGIVDVNSALTIVKGKSLNETVYTDATSNAYTFATGGTATVGLNGVVNLDRMVPGDVIVLKMENTNASNVAIKYRTTVAKESYYFDNNVKTVEPTNSNAKLADRLVIKFYSDAACTTEVTTYEKWSEPTSATALAAYYIRIEFPDGDNGEIKFGDQNADNKYQNKAAEFNFSLEAVQGNANTYVPNTDYNFADSVVEGTGANAHYVHKVANKAQFKNILTHIAANKTKTVDGVPLADQNTIYELTSDIDFLGTLWESAPTTVFTGVLKSTEGHKYTLKNIHVSAENYPSYGGSTGLLFGSIGNAIFKDFILDDITYNNTNNEKLGIIGFGCDVNDGKALGDHSYMKLQGLETTSSCSVNGKENMSAFIAHARCVQYVEISNCINNANVTATGKCAAGFFASCGQAYVETGKSEGEVTKYFSIINSINNGNITAHGSSGATAGFIGAIQGGNINDITITNSTNNGNIKNTESDYVSPFVSANSGNAINGYTYHVTNAINTGIITKNTNNACNGAFGLFAKDNNTSQIIGAEGTITNQQFFDHYVVASGVAVLNNIMTGQQTDKDTGAKELTLNFAVGTGNLTQTIWDNTAKIEVEYRIQDAKVNPSTLRGSGSNISYGSVYVKNIDKAGSQYSIPRLLYAANTYPSAIDPDNIKITYDGEEPQAGDPYVYNHKYFKADANETRTGFGLLNDKSAYYVLDNSAVSGTRFSLFVKSYSQTEYVVRLKNSSGDTLAYQSGISDLGRRNEDADNYLRVLTPSII